MDQEVFERAKSAIVTVGAARGFVIEHGHSRFVITAAHCIMNDDNLLPFPCSSAAYTSERTCKNVLAPRGGKLEIWAECLFADPISDIAVLGKPDCQELYEQCNAYEELVEGATPLSVADAPNPKGCRSWLFSLDGRWFECTAEVSEDWNGTACSIWLSGATEGIRGGMSGSPIISSDGRAIGVVCVSGGYDEEDSHTGGGPNPRLTHHLPGWLLQTPTSESKKKIKFKSSDR